MAKVIFGNHSSVAAILTFAAVQLYQAKSAYFPNERNSHEIK
jgi:hypothetical protein